MPATFSVYKTFSAGETLTAADLNSSLSQFITNLGPEGIGDYSDTATQMRSTADPYPGGAESLATDLTGELNRLRYLIAQITGETYWYQDPDANIANIISGTTAVGKLTTAVQITSTVTTGTAPLVIASTTEVANLKAATATTATQVTDGTNSIRTKIVDIGDWNMSATADVAVAHGLTLANIRAVAATIRRDDSLVFLDLRVPNTIAVAGALTVDATNINLSRTAGGPFDSAVYDATSFNRGWVTITYVL